MDTNERVLDAVLSNYRKSDRELFKNVKDLTDNQLRMELEKLNLSSPKDRNLFFWQLQVETEKHIYENIGIDDSEHLSEVIAAAWNEKNEIKITQAVSMSFLYTLNLKFPNTRKAFAYVCDGDLASYKAFSKNSKLFIDLLLRYAASNVSRMMQVNGVAHSLLPRLFEDYKKSDYLDALNRVGFYHHKKGPLNFAKMEAYKRMIGNDSLPFAAGMQEILLNVVQDSDSMDVQVLKKNIEENEATNTVQTEDEMDGLEPEANEPDTLKPQKGEDTVQSAEKEQPEHLKMQTEQEEIDESMDSKIKNSSSDADKNPIIVSLEEAVALIHTTIDKVKLLDEEKTEKRTDNTDVESRLKIAEEENDRLKNQLEQEKLKVAEAEDKALTKIFQAIGGESSNFLLSDLFEESQGNVPENQAVSTGRLVNLFSTLSLAIGLEEYAAGHELGDIFEVHKDELIRNYRIDAPITSQSDTINVKLLKYGWMINGSVVVDPLVREQKEEN